MPGDKVDLALKRAVKVSSSPVLPTIPVMGMAIIPGIDLPEHVPCFEHGRKRSSRPALARWHGELGRGTRRES